MSESESGFQQAINASPFEPMPRLVFADWLEEVGDPRAELIRVQEELRVAAVGSRQLLEEQMQSLLQNGVTPVVGWRDTSVGRLIAVPPGDFAMGPRRATVDVTISQGFWLGQTTITKAAWEAVMKTTPWSIEDYVRNFPDSPATHVLWEDADEFCRRLTLAAREDGSIGDDWTYHLPTEAEWEWACRGGTSTDFSFGDDETLLDQFAWYHDNCLLHPDGEKQMYAHSVSKKRPNPWLFFDMHGNVNEWCRDFFGRELKGGTDPLCRSEDTELIYHAHRGGSWYSETDRCRSDSRNLSALGYPRVDVLWDTFSQIGFRVALYPRPIE